MVFVYFFICVYAYLYILNWIISVLISDKIFQEIIEYDEDESESKTDELTIPNDDLPVTDSTECNEAPVISENINGASESNLLDILRACDLSELAVGTYDLQDQSSGKVQTFKLFRNEQFVTPTVVHASHVENKIGGGSEIPTTCNSVSQPTEENSQKRDDQNEFVSTEILHATDTVTATTSTENIIASALWTAELAANEQHRQEITKRSYSSTGDDVCAAENACFRMESKQPRSYMNCSKCRKFFHIECFNCNPSEIYSCFACFDYFNLSQ